MLKRFEKGSETAAFEIHDRYRTRLIQLAKQRLMGVLQEKVDPEDVSQESFLAFFELAQQGNVRWERQGDLWRLLAGIAINKTKRQFEHFSAGKRDAAIEDRFHDHDDYLQSRIVEDPQASLELTDLIGKMLESEKPILKTILSLRLAGNSNAEIAKSIGRSSRTVRRMIEVLRAKMISEGGFNFGLIQNALPYDQSPIEKSQKGSTTIKRISIDDYQLLRMIGKGSFAKVYLARHLSSGEFFAIKACQKKWFVNETVSNLFFDEAKLLMQIDHPNVVKVHGVGTFSNGGFFLALEFVDGVTLTEALESNDKDDGSVNRFYEWMAQILSAISFVHSTGIAHGDLKPSNIMVDRQSKIRILDFGLAQRLMTNQADPNQFRKDVDSISELVASFAKAIETCEMGMEKDSRERLQRASYSFREICKQCDSIDDLKSDHVARIVGILNDLAKTSK